MDVFRSALGFIAQYDERRWFVGALCHAPESAHLEFLDFVCAVDFALQSDLGGHFLGALAHVGRGHSVRGFVDHVAGEVLRFADDAT